MKTTIEINDALMERARRASARDGVTLRALVEQGLQQVLSETSKPSDTTVESLVFDGETGLTEAFADASWSTIKAATLRR